MISGIQLPNTPEGVPWEPAARHLLTGGESLLDPGDDHAKRGRSARRAAPDEASGFTHRGILYQHIRTHPGAHVRSIEKELGLGNGDLQYHLLWLEKQGFVKTRKDGFYRFVFPSLTFRDDQEVLLGLLGQKTPRELLLWLVCDPGLTQRDLATRLGHSQPTISWHIGRLVEAGLATKTRTSRGLAYQIAAEREDIRRFVKAYHPRVWSKWRGRLMETALITRREREGEKEGDTRQETTTKMLAPAVVVKS